MKKAIRRTSLAGAAICLATALFPSRAAGDEGMWTFDNPPTQQPRERYGFDINREWLDHVPLSSVRFNDGGSGSFVSRTGLVLTNATWRSANCRRCRRRRRT